MTCNANFANADGIASNGCEVNLLTDPQNCGALGHAIPAGGFNHANYACTSGVVTIASCVAGWINVDGLVGNGCEASSLPTISVSDATVTEGNLGTVNATVFITLSTPALQTISIPWITVDGTAKVASGDYLNSGGTAFIAPGQTTIALTVQVLGDTLAEADETFQVTLGNVFGVGVSKNTGLITIVNDD